MSRALALAAVIAATLTAVVPVAADDAPDPAKVKRAAEEFDLGVAAFKAKEFDEAAQHFEAADEAVPGAKTLRLAIRARAEAGQGSRAATLAAQALDRYPSDGDTARFAKETIARFEPALHRVKVSCASPCLLAIGTRAVHGARATRWVLYLDPGKASINASFLGDTVAKPRAIAAVAGGATDVRFEPPAPRDGDGPRLRDGRRHRRRAPGRRPRHEAGAREGHPPRVLRRRRGAHGRGGRRPRVERPRHPLEPGPRQRARRLRGQGPGLP